VILTPKRHDETSIPPGDAQAQDIEGRLK